MSYFRMNEACWVVELGTCVIEHCGNERQLPFPGIKVG